MNITWKIGGEAGFGIMTTGVMFSRLATRHGYHIFDYIEYPSLIRGGHNVYEVCISEREVFSQEKGVDLLFALNQETIDLHKDELKSGAILAYDNEQIKLDSQIFQKGNIILYPIPYVRLTREINAAKIMENNVALGASAALLQMDKSILENLIADTFCDKGEEIIKANQQAAQVGFDYVISHKPKGFSRALPKQVGDKKLVTSGNESSILGAIAAGCRFYAAYPMTPTSSALHFMAEWGEKYGVVVKHAEDEIAVINMAIGASYAGVRSMVGTAGGGFSLMVEGLGLAGITETPLVILMGMRPGPATGMPTWTGQGDLEFLVHASQDEFPRIILAPGDINEAFYLTAEAFNLADIYQTPVFILTDKYLGESHKSAPIFNGEKIIINRGKTFSWEESDRITNYLRYQITEDGITPRAFPGMKTAIFTANSYEHNTYGYSTESGKERVEQVDKRNRKLATYLKVFPPQHIYGSQKADLTLVGWGSTKGPVLEAMKRLEEAGFDKKVNFLHFTHVWPISRELLKPVLSQAPKTLLLEGNSQAQMGNIIHAATGVELTNRYLRFDGRPFYPEDIMDKIKEQFV